MPASCHLTRLQRQRENASRAPEHSQRGGSSEGGRDGGGHNIDRVVVQDRQP